MTCLGTRYTEAGEVPFGLTQADRFQHLYVIGQTGTGKTSLLKRLAIDDMNAGRGLAFIDPHGDAAQELLDHVPPQRMRHVIYLNPSDHLNCFGLNLLQSVPPHERDRVTQNVVGTFRYRWDDSWGARMEWIFKNTVRALLDCPTRYGATLLGIPRMYSDPTFRSWVTSHIKNPEAQTFWQSNFPSWNDRQRSEYTAPVVNKVSQFLLSDVLRNTLGQAFSTIDLSYIMDNRRILIVNLDKGQLGADDADLLGSLLVTAMQLVAMKRSDIPTEKRVPFFCYLDEFHSFTTRAFTSILSEARKYKFGIVAAHQYLAQAHDDVRAAILGNVGTTISFRVGGDDAHALSRHLGLPTQSIEELSLGEVAVKLTSGGVTNNFFGNAARPTDDTYHGRREKLIAYSTTRYTKPVSEVGERIARWRKNLHH